jgi:beta-lactamase superfamily II metal-dependent hydrolase
MKPRIPTADKAPHNSSVVFCVHWRGKKLLFAGDAGLGSWRMMAKEVVLEPVDFIKVSHHGSHNGTPDDEVFDAILPAGPVAGRCGAVSQWEKTYSGIPHASTNQRRSARCALRSTLDDPNALSFDVPIHA